MGNTNQPNGSAAGSAALAVAEASAAAGATAARLGYQLTTEALKQSGAAAVFPLLVLELTAIAESFAAYVAVDAVARVAAARVQAGYAAGVAYWSGSPP